jgi:hypothetical protein
MGKIKIFLSLLFIFVIITGFGFGKKDVSYYRAHPEKAKIKLSACQKIMEKLIQDADVEKLEKIMSDPECQAADIVVNEIEKAERKKAWEKKKKEVDAKRAKEKKKFETEKAKREKLLITHDVLYRDIPLFDRMDSRSPVVAQWKEKGRNIAHGFIRWDEKAQAKAIYKESYEIFLNNPIAKEKQYAQCLEFKKEHLKNKRRLAGPNECSAVYDIIESELTQKYITMPLEERVEKMMKCEKAEDNDICKKSLSMANKEIRNNFHSDRETQYTECNNLKKRLIQIDYDYIYEVRSAGECRAINFR